MSFAGPGIVIGNAGDAYYNSEGRVLLRDFLEMDRAPLKIHGWSIDEEMRDQVESVNLHMSEDEKAQLAMLLTRLDVPGFPLGRVLAKALTSHRWAFVSKPPVPTSNNEPNLDLSMRYTHIQIASRINQRINISYYSYLKMPSTHKVGLVIHELISSLLKPECKSSNDCFQDAAKARHLVRTIFSQSSDPSSEAFREILLSDLNMALLLDNVSSSEVQIKKGDFVAFNLKSNPSGISDFYLSPSSLPLSLDEIENFCRKLTEKKRLYSINVSIIRNSIEIEPESYPMKNPYQAGITLDGLKAKSRYQVLRNFNLSNHLTDPVQCTKHLELIQFFD